MAEGGTKHTCGICLDYFTNPKLIDCFHTFCEACLGKYVDSLNTDPGDNFPCPMCRKLAKLPVDGVKGFSVNFYITSPEIVEMEDELDPQLRVASSCQQHQKNMDLYCNDCRVAICSVCFSRKHKHHDVGDIHCIAKKTISKLRNVRANLGEILVELHSNSRLVKSENARIKCDLEKQCGRVDEQVETVCEFIRTKGDSIKTEMRQFSSRQHEDMNLLDQTISNMISKSDEFKQQTAQVLKSGSVSDTMTLPHEIHKFIDGESVELLTVPRARLIRILDANVGVWSVNSAFGQLDIDPVTPPIQWKTELKFSIHELKKNTCVKSSLIQENGLHMHIVVKKQKGWRKKSSLDIELQMSDSKSRRIRFNIRLLNSSDNESVRKEDMFRFGFLNPIYKWRNVIHWEIVSDRRNGFTDGQNRLTIELTVLDVLIIVKENILHASPQ